MENYGSRPDHKVLTAHPSVSGEFLTRLGCGDISVKPGLKRLDGDGVIFTDGSREESMLSSGDRLSHQFSVSQTKCIGCRQ